MLIKVSFNLVYLQARELEHNGTSGDGKSRGAGGAVSDAQVALLEKQVKEKEKEITGLRVELEDQVHFYIA